ncbi:MAG: signal peptide peptidase SppA [Bacteroidetes bacterium]|nr:MAG: signal peptide peptidase SppA [Bacteroidota bacterium]PTM13783.1 MAG: signal peptide peptidase SppA [Bacteroidota bacterium]
MRQFFKFLLASCLGTLIGLFVLFFVVIGGVARIASSASKASPITSNSVLHLKLNQAIPELMDNVEPSSFGLNNSSVLGLHDITAAIKQATKDDDIKGIFLEPELAVAGFTSLATIRQALADFKASGKFIYAYAPYYTQGAYYLASVSDEVVLAPLGIVDWRGFSATYPFFKDVLDRVGVDYEVFFAGRYKSASEPYRRNDMSAESKAQTRAFLDEMYRLMLNDVSASRNVSVEKLDELADTYAGINPEAALTGGLVDKTIYREALLAEMREALGLAVNKEISFVKLNDYFEARVTPPAGGGDRIALLMAEGVIVDGKGDIAQIGDKTYIDLIEDISKDDRVKAVVLRVNSPGGSAMASDHIWQALMDLKATGKPLVVSMGSVAASGGYYIAAPADRIFAEPSTITGSIGVVSAIPQFQELLKEKIGVHFDSVKTGPFSAGINPVFDMSEGEKALLRARTDQMYQTFLKRVSTGRNISVADVDSVAQGRVWVGTTALQKGLVDELGGLEKAIENAATLAKITSYKTTTYPKPQNPWERLFNEIMNPQETIQKAMLKDQLGTMYPYYNYLQEMADGQGMQMRLPFMIAQ